MQRSGIARAAFVLLVAGAFSYAGAQNKNVSTGAGATSGVGASNPTITRVKTSKEVTPSWTAKGTFYGFLTCDKIQNQGSKATADDIKKCVAGGGQYYFGETNVNRDAAAQAKLAPFVGNFVAVNVTMTAARYGTGPTSDAAVEGLPSGGDRPTSRRLLWDVVSVSVDPTPDPREGAARSGGRAAATDEVAISSLGLSAPAGHSQPLAVPLAMPRAAFRQVDRLTQLIWRGVVKLVGKLLAWHEPLRRG